MISLSFGFGAIVAVSACGPQSDAALQDAKRSAIPTFESELWPGEGVPVIEAVSRRIILRVSPRGDAEVADTLLDVQYVTPHLKRFGVVEVSAAEYERTLADAIARRCTFV